MPDLHRLLEDAAHAPTSAPDPEELWRNGRRRRRVAQGAAAGGAAAVLAGILAVGVSLVDRADGVDIGPVAPSASSPAATASDPDPTVSEPGAGTEPTAAAAPRPAPDVLTAAGSEAGPANPTTIAQVTIRDGSVELRRRQVEGTDERFTVATDDPAATVQRFAVDPGGAIVFQVVTDGRTRVLRLPADAREPVELVRSTDELQVGVLGAGELDGEPVLLVAQGRARSLLEDDGTTIVAYRADGTPQVLVEDAAVAWEGGVSAADVRDGFVVWQALDTTIQSVWLAPVGSPADRHEVARSDPEAGEPEVVDLLLVGRDRSPVLGMLLHHRAAYPDEPSAELRTVELPDLRARSYEVGPVGWEEGLPAALSRVDDAWLVSRMGEGHATRAALVGVPPDWTPAAFDGIVRTAD